MNSPNIAQRKSANSSRAHRRGTFIKQCVIHIAWGIGTGLLLICAHPIIGLWPFIFVAFTLLLHHAHRNAPSFAGLTGFFCGVIFGACSYGWSASHPWWHFAALICWQALYWALFLFLSSVCARKVRERRRPFLSFFAPLIDGCAFATLEVLKENFLFYPSLSLRGNELSSFLADSPLANFLPTISHVGVAVVTVTLCHICARILQPWGKEYEAKASVRKKPKTAKVQTNHASFALYCARSAVCASVIACALGASVFIPVSSHAEKEVSLSALSQLPSDDLPTLFLPFTQCDPFSRDITCQRRKDSLVRLSEIEGSNEENAQPAQNTVTVAVLSHSVLADARALSSAVHHGARIAYAVSSAGENAKSSDRKTIHLHDKQMDKWQQKEEIARARVRALEMGISVLYTDSSGEAALFDAKGRQLSHSNTGVESLHGTIPVRTHASPASELLTFYQYAPALICAVFGGFLYWRKK